MGIRTGVPGLLKEDANIFPQEKTTPEILYVWTRRDKILDVLPKEPTYNYVHGIMGKDWIAVSEEQYKNAVSVLEKNGSRIRDIPEAQELNAFLLNNCLAIVGQRYLSAFDETQHFIGAFTENQMDKIKGLAMMLDLPVPKSDAELIQNEISRTGWIELGQ